MWNIKKISIFTLKLIVILKFIINIDCDNHNLLNTVHVCESVWVCVSRCVRVRVRVAMRFMIKWKLRLTLWRSHLKLYLEQCYSYENRVCPENDRLLCMVLHKVKYLIRLKSLPKHIPLWWVPLPSINTINSSTHNNVNNKA